MAKIPLGHAKLKTTALRPANFIKIQQTKCDNVLILALRQEWTPWWPWAEAGEGADRPGFGQYSKRLRIG